MVTATEAFTVKGEDGTEDAAEGEVLKRGSFWGILEGRGGAGSAGGDDGHDLFDLVLGYCVRLEEVSMSSLYLVDQMRKWRRTYMFLKKHVDGL